MCFVLYAGTTTPMPRWEWRKEAPDVSVAALTERDAPIGKHFTQPEVQYIGSTSGCGCDFPHVTLHKGGWSIFELGNHAERKANDRYNREALVGLLQNTGEKMIELYGVWDGDFAETPKVMEQIPFRRIMDSDFYFKEQGFYRVIV